MATPIEQQLQGVDNMIYMTSVNSSSGLMRLRVDFDVGTNANTDQILTQMRYLQAESQLPIDVAQPRGDHPQVGNQPAGAVLSLLAEGNLRRALSSPTTRTSTSTIR